MFEYDKREKGGKRGPGWIDYVFYLAGGLGSSGGPSLCSLEKQRGFSEKAERAVKTVSLKFGEPE